MADYLKTTIAACQAGDDHTTRQMALLALVGRGKHPKRFKLVADELSISKPATTRAADRLVSEGLMQRVPVAEDARQVDLALTDAGRALLARAQAGFAAETAVAA